MTDYIKTVDFAAKDALITGNPAKIVSGTEINTEFANIATAIATKANSNSPTLTTPNIGTPSSGALTNCTGLPIVAGTTGTLSVARGGTGVTTSTGTGNVVLSTSPTLVTPVLGTPTSGNLANCTFPTLNQNTTGTAGGLSATLGIASGGTGQTSATAAFNALAGNSSLANSGYKYFGNLLVQWGRWTAVTQSDTVTFPIAFPTAVFGIVSNSFRAAQTGTYPSFLASDITTTNFVGGVNYTSYDYFYIAIGH